MIANVNSIETFGSVDGPGVRFVLFLSSCPFRCLYCHNPETWTTKGAERLDAETILRKALRYRGYWGKEGGITVSGGEPLNQIDFLIEFFSLCKKEGIHTCIDTALANFTTEGEYFEKFKKLMAVTDLLLVDIKEIDEKKHILLTGKTNRYVLEGLRYLSDIQKPVWIRHVLVPGYTDFDEDLRELRAFIDTLDNVQRVEVLPYHDLAKPKYAKLSIPYPLADVLPPTKDRVENAKRILKAF